MEYDYHRNDYRLTAENEEDENFLKFLDEIFENCSFEKKRYWRPALSKASSIGENKGKKYIDFEVSSLRFKIAEDIKLDVIVDDERPIPLLTSRLFLTPSRKKN